jgi:glycosyltransferase involved in cell wall biosynthesis
MLRIAIYYESGLGRNDGNPLYVLSFLKRVQYYGHLCAGQPKNDNLLSSFAVEDDCRTYKEDPAAKAYAEKLWEERKERLEIEHVAPNPAPKAEIKKFGTFDLNVWVDWGEDGLKGILPYEPFECPHPMAYWCSDSHLGYDYRLMMAKKAEFPFCAQKRAVEDMAREGVNALWLPHAVEPMAYPKFTFASKKYDVCFVGHINSENRVNALDRLFKEFPNFFYGQRLFDEASRIFGQSKIVFNISMKDDLNMRVFEAMASGSMLLTNWIPTIEEIFEDGKHLVLYRDEAEMVEKARYFIEHDEEREAIAQKGYEEVIRRHKIKDRVEMMLENSLFKKVVLKEAVHASSI